MMLNIALQGLYESEKINYTGTNEMNSTDLKTWNVKKIGVIGAGIVGVPMAALLAHAKIQIGSEQPARVVLIQRNSSTSGWKVDAINSGRSPIGGIEPELDQILSDAMTRGLLRASHNYKEIQDADVILVCVQTDKKHFEPDYGPLFDALKNLVMVLEDKPKEKMPLIIFESTLAPSSMITLIKDYFERAGLVEGRDILLGNSPNRVMPGRLVERIAQSDKVIGGLSRITTERIRMLYDKIVAKGTLHCTNSITAEIIKTLENAYRDVRIAFSSEMVRYCDLNDIDFYRVRDWVNNRLSQSDAASSKPNAVPTGAMLIPTIGVGGHCLPKDGILLLWRMIESKMDISKSIILESRRINDESPDATIGFSERHFGKLEGKSITLLGAAYRFNSDDTRNSPTFILARHLLEKGCKVVIHDPYVKPNDQNLTRYDLQGYFTQDISHAVKNAEYIIFCTAHQLYLEERENIISTATQLRGIIDGCNLFKGIDFEGTQLLYTGIGRGNKSPDQEFLDFVLKSFRIVERGMANEIERLINFFNDRYAFDDFNRADFNEIQRIAGTCVTGCSIVEPEPIINKPEYHGFSSRLVRLAIASSGEFK